VSKKGAPVPMELRVIGHMAPSWETLSHFWEKPSHILAKILVSMSLLDATISAPEEFLLTWCMEAAR
jgi:hypothetical protein